MYCFSFCLSFLLNMQSTFRMFVLHFFQFSLSDKYVCVSILFYFFFAATFDLCIFNPIRWPISADKRDARYKFGILQITTRTFYLSETSTNESLTFFLFYFNLIFFWSSRNRIRVIFFLPSVLMCAFEFVFF